MEILVGHTGFVGSNIASRHEFDALFNSKNISQAYGLEPDLCVYAGVRAEKYLSASDPDADMAIIEKAINNIRIIKPRLLVLISTIDVYPHPYDVDELSEIDINGAHPYGSHRYYLEQWVKANVPDHLIVRLPALFGKNIKKNFIYDMIHLVPSTLKAEKYAELSENEPLIRECYACQGNGFYKCIALDSQHHALKNAFENLGFTALNFTDSRASYQFYNLSYLWNHISIALQNRLSLINLAVEPIRADEVYRAVRGDIFINEISTNIAAYDFRTLYAELFGGSEGYVFRKDQVLNDVCNFIKSAENGDKQ